MRLLVTCLALALAGCDLAPTESIQDFVARGGGATPGNMAALPRPLDATPVAYDAKKLRDPFTAAARPAPDPRHVRRGDPLEVYALDALRMVGTLRQGGITVAIVRAPDGQLYHVRAGDGIGTGYGVVTEIAEGHLKVAEPVLGAAEPAERQVVIRLGAGAA